MNLIIEMGGTNINLFVTNESDLYSKMSISTNAPDDFKKYMRSNFRAKAVQKLVLACFGPVSLESYNYGQILNSPKKLWRHENIYNWLKSNICNDIVMVNIASGKCVQIRIFWGT